MTKGARYSTFNPPTSNSSTPGKMMRLFASSWIFLGCCCGSCYKRQKPPRTSSASVSNGVNATSRMKILEPIIELTETPLIDSTELTMEEIPLRRIDCGVPKDDEGSSQDIVDSEEALLISRKGHAIDTSYFRSKSSSCGTMSEMKRVINGLPVLPKKEKQQPVTDYEKKTSHSDSEIGYTSSSIFTKCSKRHDQQKVPTFNIPELIIS